MLLWHSWETIKIFPLIRIYASIILRWKCFNSEGKHNDYEHTNKSLQKLNKTQETFNDKPTTCFKFVLSHKFLERGCVFNACLFCLSTRVFLVLLRSNWCKKYNIYVFSLDNRRQNYWQFVTDFSWTVSMHIEIFLAYLGIVSYWLLTWESTERGMLPNTMEVSLIWFWWN